MFSKLLFSDVKHKPLNAALIVLSVALSVCVLYCAMSFGRIMEAFFFDTESAEKGRYDIVASSNSLTGSNFVQAQPIKDVEGVECVVGSLYLPATYNGEVVKIAGFEDGEKEIINPVDALSSCCDNLNDLPRDHVVICKSFAEAHGLQLYDSFTLKMLSKEQTLYVGCIADDTGYFFGNTAYIIGNVRHIGKLVGWSGGNLYNRVYVRCRDGADVDKIAAEIGSMPEYSAVDVAKFDLQTTAKLDSRLYTVLFQVAAVLLSLLIAAALFNLAEIRLSSKTAEAACLQIIGATPTKVCALYLCRFGIIGIIGIIIGSFVGIGALTLIVQKTIMPQYVVQNVGLIFAAAACAFVILLLSALVPVVRVAKNGLGKSLFSSKITAYKPRYLTAAVFAVAFVVLTSISYTVRRNLGVTGLLNVAAIIGLVISGLPVLIHGIGSLLSKTSQGAAHLAGLTLGRDKHVASGAVLLCLAMLVCVTTSSSLNLYVNFKNKTDDFKKTHVVVEHLDNLTNEDYEYLDTIDGAVTRRYYYSNNTEIKFGNKALLADVYATDGLGCEDFYDAEYKLTPLSEVKNIIDENANKLIVSEQFLYCYNLNIGDIITINYLGKQADFEIGGYVATIKNNGLIILANNAYFAKTFSSPLASELYIATDDINGVAAKITDKLSNKDVYVAVLTSKNSISYASDVKLSRFFNYFVQLISAMVIIVVCFSVFLSDSFRKKEYAKYAVEGADEKSLAVLCLIEGLTVAGVAAAAAAAVSVPLVQSAVDAVILSGFYFGEVFDALSTALIPVCFAAAYLLTRLFSFLSRKKDDNLVLFKE